MKILNLYAGVGGQRTKWNGHTITAVESDENIASIYQTRFPEDQVVVGDAHEYLLNHFEGFDFIWSSPPCQSHSKMVKFTRHKIRKYPDLSLYEEIIFLGNFFSGKWVVENVVPYYKPLVTPTKQVGRHLFWASFNFECSDVERPSNFINKCNQEGKQSLADWLGFDFPYNAYYDGNHDPSQVLRNCVHPNIGEEILNQVE